jgi:2-phosphoglycolate phosphatase
MERTPEPELMNDAAQAAAYAAADFEAPHTRFIALFRERFPDVEVTGEVLDLGCGPGDIALRFARAFERCRVVGLDGSQEMLKAGRGIQFRQPPELRDRVLLVHGLLPAADLHGQTFDTVISNSLLHHLHDPAVLWNAVRKFARPGARVFIGDLRRPATNLEALQLTNQHCRGEPEVLRRDFYNSLLASFTADEIRAQLKTAGLEHFTVEEVGDRHVIIWGTLKDLTAAESLAQQAAPAQPRAPALRPHPPFKAVLFDLDGTLLDTLQDLADAVNRVMKKRGHPTHDIEAIRWFIGEGARMLVERALPEAKRTEAEIEAALADYRTDYMANWNVATKPYGGIVPLLHELHARGLALGVLSNKPHAMTVRCIEGYLREFPFKAVLGQRDEVAKKPHPEGAHEAARLMGCKTEEILYVGDTAVDMQTARAAGMIALGATWGFRPESELRENGADAIIHAPLAVLDFV